MTLAIIIAACGAEEFNGTTYRLAEREIMVTQPVQASELNLTLSLKTDNITLRDESGRKVEINSSYQFWRGDHIYRLRFGRNVSGDLVYTIAHTGQQFILPMRDSGAVRIVLPKGYTTGDRILGIARPAPDEVQTEMGKEVLTWHNTSQIQYIEVSYYQDYAPKVMMAIFAILALSGIVLLLEYYISIRKLRAISREAEEASEDSRKGKRKI